MDDCFVSVEFAVFGSFEASTTFFHSEYAIAFSTASLASAVSSICGTFPFSTASRISDSSFPKQLISFFSHTLSLLLHFHAACFEIPYVGSSLSGSTILRKLYLNATDRVVEKGGKNHPVFAESILVDVVSVFP